MLSFWSDEGLEVGRIKLILVHQNSVVYFVSEKRHAVHLVDLGVYCITDVDQRLCTSRGAVRLLPSPGIQNLPVVALHHSFPSL